MRSLHPLYFFSFSCVQCTRHFVQFWIILSRHAAPYANRREIARKLCGFLTSFGKNVTSFDKHTQLINFTGRRTWNVANSLKTEPKSSAFRTTQRRKGTKAHTARLCRYSRRVIAKEETAWSITSRLRPDILIDPLGLSALCN